MAFRSTTVIDAAFFACLARLWATVRPPIPQPRTTTWSPGLVLLVDAQLGSSRSSLISSGSCFERIFSPGLAEPQETQLLPRFFIAEAAKPYRVLAGFRHEPGRFRDWLRFLAPAALHRVFR